MAEVRRYYLVAALKAGASRQAVFTYHSPEKIPVGKLVKIHLGAQSSPGVVVGTLTKPSFTTKPIDEVLSLSPLPTHLLKLADWISKYYVTGLGRVWQTLLPAGLFVSKPQVRTKPELSSELKLDVKLVPQQQAAVSTITKSAKKSFLLYGATGSGKTQVYIELAKRALAEGASTIMLVPEIALTPQITARFLANFGDQVILTHSGLSPAARRVSWQSALETSSPKVIIGPRSALFCPLPRLGYIIIDEAHDSSYKQDQSPRYHATMVAAELSRLTGAKLILGSATPSASDSFLAERGYLKLVTMPKPIFKAKREITQVIDLKNRAELSPSPYISKSLLKTLETTLANSKQAILFLNRRGSARLMLCTNCGWAANCPNCQIPLTWHADAGQLRCHWCNYHAPPPVSCPGCHRLSLRFVGAGTKRLEIDIQKLLPSARVARLDRDSFDARTIEGLYRQLERGEIDILIGTQMITKGLDLPGVEAIGIILADSLLYLPDYASGERTFQLLYQVGGRAGRRTDSLAQVVIQTYSPNHPAIQAAASGNYQAFIKNELAERQLLNYPPFVYLLKLATIRPTRESARAAAQTLANQITSNIKHPASSLQVVGPAPSWRETMGGKFSWQIIVKSKQRSKLVAIANNLPAGWTHDLDPIDLL